MKQLPGVLVALVATGLLIAVALSYGGPILYELEMLAHFRLHLLLLAALIILLTLLLGRWMAAWRAFAAAILAGAGLFPVMEKPVISGSGQRLTVMTANLYQNNPDPEAMLAALIAADPDILVTNETTKATQSGPLALTDRYPYRLSLFTTGNTLRTVIWSRLPMRDGRLMLEDSVQPTGAAAVVPFDGTGVSIIGLHLAHAYPGNQERQIDALADIVRPLPPSRIVLGDFNAAPWSHAMRRIEEVTETDRIPGYRITWQGVYRSVFGRLPAPIGHAIDHILVSDGIGVEEVRTVAIPGSDHRGVLAVLRIPDS